MEAFSEAIKVFAEKHLIPTVISLITGAIFYLFTPENSWFIGKLSRVGYWLLLSGCIFLFVQLLIWIKKEIENNKYKKSLNAKNDECKRSFVKERIGVLWDYVDSLDQEDRKILKQFLKSKNKPYVVRGKIFYAPGKLLSSKDVHKQEGYDEKGSFTKYVLDDSLYNALVASSELYGKISRFEEV